MRYWSISPFTGAVAGAEWTSVADVGKVVGGHRVTWAEYAAVEDRFVEAFRLVCAAAGAGDLEVVSPWAGRPVPEGFPPFHSGARTGVEAAARIVRAVLREQAWCGFSRPDRFGVTFGDDLYMYVRAPDAAADVRASVRALGLGMDDLDPPDDELFDGDPDDHFTRPADAAFWAAADRLAPAAGHRLLVAERWARGTYGRTWYAPAPGHVGDLAGRVTPRSLIEVRPSVPPCDDHAAAAGRVVARPADDPPRLTVTYLRESPVYDPSVLCFPDPGDTEPALRAVVPDSDGTVRARWPA